MPTGTPQAPRNYNVGGTAMANRRLTAEEKEQRERTERELHEDLLPDTFTAPLLERSEERVLGRSVELGSHLAERMENSSRRGPVHCAVEIMAELGRYHNDAQRVWTETRGGEEAHRAPNFHEVVYDPAFERRSTTAPTAKGLPST